MGTFGRDTALRAVRQGDERAHLPQAQDRPHLPLLRLRRRRAQQAQHLLGPHAPQGEDVEARVWDVVSGILKDPERLRVGLDHMIEQEGRGASFADDPATETERWLEEISKASHKRARYQEMAAEGLIDFEELRTRLSALEDARKATELELRALQRRADHLAQLQRDRDSLLESYADLIPEAFDSLSPEERRRVYKMIGLEVHLAPDGSYEISGDVVSFSKLEISSA
jgi:hypothetical protein